MDRKTKSAVLAACLFLVAASRGSAGEERSFLERVLGENLRALQQYRWVEHRITTVNGNRQNDATFAVTPDGDGTFKRTQTSAKEQRFANRKQEEDAHWYRDHLEQLVASYAEELRPEKLQRFVAKGSSFDGAGDHLGQLGIQSNNVVQKGDSMCLYVDSRAGRPRSLDVATHFKKDAVSIAVTFGVVDGVVWCPRGVTVTSPARAWNMTIENSDFVRPATVSAP